MRNFYLLVIALLPLFLGGCTKNGSVNPESVQSVSLNLIDVEKTEGTTFTLKASVEPTGARVDSIKWNSSNENVAKLSSDTGESIVVTAVKKGECKVKVTVNGDKTAECRVVVSDGSVPVESVKLDKTSLKMPIGGTSTLSFTVEPEGASISEFKWTSSDETIATVSDAGLVTALKEGGCKVKVTVNGDKTAECDINVSPSTSSLFTINSTGTKVSFSKGNLQATYVYATDSYSWGFAPNQYSYIGNNPGNTSITWPTDGDVIDLFGWSTKESTNPYGISIVTDNSAYSGDFKDWGTAIDDKGTWRTLTDAEWIYLIDNRSATLCKYGVNVCDVSNCVILAPDGFQGEIAESYTSDTWSAAEKQGLVCLPAAGEREGSNVNFSAEKGTYWSSTPRYSQNAHYLFFDNNGINPDIIYYRWCGRSVRLVHVIE